VLLHAGRLNRESVRRVGDSNRSRGDELDNEEYYSLFVPATKDMTTQTSNPDEEVEFMNCQQEDDGIDNGIIGCAANGKESEERLVLDLMKRLEKLEEVDVERIEMEMEKNKRIDSLERNVEVLRSKLEMERKNNQKLIEELANHYRSNPMYCKLLFKYLIKLFF
jgi:hypothetical protein